MSRVMFEQGEKSKVLMTRSVRSVARAFFDAIFYFVSGLYLQ